MNSEAHTQPRWILSFADLLSVVLSFLVLAYSMSLPPSTKEKYKSKSGTGVFSVNDSRHEENIAITSNNQDLSTNYLRQVMEKKVKADQTIAGKIAFSTEGDSLTMTIDAKDFIDSAPALTQLLKVLKNDIWIYAANLDTSRNAYDQLKKNGFGKDITLMQSELGKTQIDIVVHP